ncbi:hypothetical protein PC116_g28929 [Phytophthora cactorum]|nr:hypothetical protein PC114_g26984 [Phytophthora cactorum]KAG2959457.1 hypothetical protein PC119_g26700 [Phytophthora cactorum]KAG2980081.1 hypothetical protein PC120_g25026 [Phytophthora cactorum]KAG3123004.1 hypothetical protein C6341_g26741 [Phytophthora cactorum]KAG3138573.1 hypothetical protein PC128_g25541 [Phytophthora cactorum]
MTTAVCSPRCCTAFWDSLLMASGAGGKRLERATSGDI